MSYGLLSGILWGLDTVILGIALSMTPFISSEEAIMFAPFISTFLHDFFSSIWTMIYLFFSGSLKEMFKVARTKSGCFIVLGALLGGPIGMSGYLLAIKYIGSSYTAIISALYPAVGAFLSYVFLKEKMKPISIIGLFMSIAGIILLGYSPVGEVNNLLLGFLFAFVCVIGWASEAVICSYGMKDEEITPDQSLQVRQMTSAIFYGIVIIPILGAVNFTANVIPTNATVVIMLAALVGTASYLCYYKGIHQIGSTKAMSLNITYSAWAIIIGVFLNDNVIDVKCIICCLIIIVGSILASGDIKELKNIFVKIN